MQAIILAAKIDSDTFPLTVTRPKACLKVMNKCVLEHTLGCLKGLVDDVIIVVGFKKEKIIEKIGSGYDGIPVNYIEVEEPWSTLAALKRAVSLINGRFFLLSSDYLYDQSELRTCGKHKRSVLSNPIEDQDNHDKNLASDCSCYVMEKSFIIDHPGKREKQNGEEEVLAGALAAYTRKNDMFVLQSKKWLPIPYAWSLLEVNEICLSGIESSIEGTVEPTATIKGKVVIGNDTIIKNGAYIEGPVVIGNYCTIGPNCFIRAFTSIGDHCTIGNAVEVKNSIIGDYVNVCHLSYLGDSIIGDRVNIGAGNISANLRHDNRSVVTVLNGEKIDTKRRKLGVIIGDFVHTGINNSFYPGRKIWPHLSTLPGEVIKEDRTG